MPSLSLNKIGLGLELPAQTASFIFALDSLSASSAAAYSTRKLRSAYAGQCMNVRRSSDNATQDIGFVNNVLDTASLLTFVADRPGHDRRYAIDTTKIESELGWKPLETFETGLRRTIAWYLDHPIWVERATSGKYRRERLGLTESASAS